MQVNVIIKSTNAGKTLSTTLSYVNPQAANNKLLALVRALNALTTNTFVTATKETKGETL